VSRRLRAVILVAAGVFLAPVGGLAGASTRAHRPPQVSIHTLANRADLLSGSDTLVGISVPGRGHVRVTLDGHNVTRRFAWRRDGGFRGLIGLITGLEPGRHTVRALLSDGGGAWLRITDHRIGGPVFSGPQIQPWVCGTQSAGLGASQDRQCDAPTKYAYEYKSSATGQFETYNPQSPPPDVATTTTDQGVTVPYIVRVEEGTEDRGLYELAVLYQPHHRWMPWSPQRGWNHKLVVPFGASTAPHHSQDAPTGVLDDTALSRGFMVADSGLNVQGSDANANVSAEALMMLKEHIRDTYGYIRYTIGNGCSGGGLQQYMVAAMYPGLLDGIQPNCSFADMWSTAPDVGECHGLIDYFQNNPSEPWVPQIDGHRDPSDCEAWNETFWPVTDPGKASNCNLPQKDVYNPQSNPRGTRCDLQDYQIDIWGRRPRSEWGPVERRIQLGFAERPFDNVGVEYGLRALQEGLITPAEFADLNAKAGGADIDGNSIPQRDFMDRPTAITAYRTGQITDARQLADVPIIDLRGYSETGEIHTSVYSYTMRARLDRANGNHANQVIWTWEAYFPIVGMSDAFVPDIALRSFLLMDRWLSRIEADHRHIPRAVKVREDKPSAARDACFLNRGQEEVTNTAECHRLYPYYGTTRTAAGGPLTNDVIKCHLKPLRRTSFKVAFTKGEWAELQRAFPTGVCDYSRPGVGQRPSIPWMGFMHGPGGEPLGAPPSSHAFAAVSRA
jgi:hypothetical protein